MKTVSFILACVFSGAMLFAAPDEKEKRLSLPGPPARGDRGPRGPYVWRAFSELSDRERMEMTGLQRNDPEKFREIMTRKAEEILRREQEERRKLADLSEKYRTAGSDRERIVIRQQLTELVKKRFDKRLTGNRRQLEAMKRQAAKLEEELDRREKNADKIVEMIVESVLKGEKPHRGRNSGPHPCFVPKRGAEPPPSAVGNK